MRSRREAPRGVGVVEGVVEEAQRSACQDGRLALGAGDAVVRVPVEILAEDLEQFPTLRAEISTDALPDAPDESVLLSVSFDDGLRRPNGGHRDVPLGACVVVVRVYKPAQLPSADLLLHLKEATCGEREHLCGAPAPSPNPPKLAPRRPLRPVPPTPPRPRAARRLDHSGCTPAG